MILKIILLSVLSYLIGAIPFALIVGKVFYNQDIRTMGSGNLGTTNAFRCLGKKAGISVFVLDITKGIVAVWIPSLVLGNVDYLALFGACAMIGHIFPIFANFKGGKAVAAGSGVFIFLYPTLSLILVVIFLSILFLTGYVSLGSITISAFSIVYLALFEHTISSYIMIVMCMFVIYVHKKNIYRLLNGTENKSKLKIKWGKHNDRNN